jgi:RNA polymerase sigma-70 factor (ECF subfamily)
MEDAPTGWTPDDAKQLRSLRDGDEAAFSALVDRYHGPLLRLAMAFVPSHAVAEEVVQETWLGVLEGLSRFEGRSSLKTWLYRILINRAKTRGVRESRSVPFSPLGASPEDAEEPAADPARFRSTGYWIDHWAEPPGLWDDDTPEKLLLSKEGLAQIEKAIAALPPTQRQVITLRDVEGLASGEVCNILALSETNQRVQLHRARSRVRRALARYLEGGGSPT